MSPTFPNPPQPGFCSPVDGLMHPTLYRMMVVVVVITMMMMMMMMMMIQ